MAALTPIPFFAKQSMILVVDSPAAYDCSTSVITSGGWCLPTKPGLCVNLCPQLLHLYLGTVPFLFLRTPRFMQSVPWQNVHVTQGSVTATSLRTSSASLPVSMTMLHTARMCLHRLFPYRWYGHVHLHPSGPNEMS